MYYLTIFVLVITSCFGLNESISCSDPNNLHRQCGNARCRLNTLEFRNELKHGILKVNCTSNQKIKMGLQDVKVNSSYSFSFAEINDRRIVWACLLNQGPKMEYSHILWRAYRGAHKPRCGQVRKWVARNDGIYLERNSESKGFQHPWHK